MVIGCGGKGERQDEKEAQHFQVEFSTVGRIPRAEGYAIAKRLSQLTVSDSVIDYNHYRLSVCK